MSYTILIPILRTGLSIKRKRCEGHPFPNVCTLSSVAIIPPAHRWYSVLKREKTVPQIFRDDAAITLNAIEQTLSGNQAGKFFEKQIKKHMEMPVKQFTPKSK